MLRKRILKHQQRYSLAQFGKILLVTLLSTAFFSGITLSPLIVYAGMKCSFTQLTDSMEESTLDPAISDNGNRIVLRSDVDLTGENDDQNSELYLYDVGSRTLTQITDTVSCSNMYPAIDADGTVIAFRSSCDHTGENSDLNVEMFLYDLASDTFVQITKTTTGVVDNPSVNADGNFVVFESNKSMDGHNTDTNSEIFLYNRAASSITAITDTTGGSNREPSIDSTGDLVAFRSNRDFTGANADLNSEIFLYKISTSSFTQITDSAAGSSYMPEISAGGGSIVFRSYANLTGENPDNNSEIILYDVKLASNNQITDTPSGYSNLAPSVNLDGSRLSFHSSADLTGENTDGNFEIFLYDSSSGLTQITNTANLNNVNSSMDASGMNIAFISYNDLTGENSDKNREIFLWGCTEMAGSVISVNCLLLGD